jgi:molybdenum cofactor synthesis domain-containing protein
VALKRAVSQDPARAHDWPARLRIHPSAFLAPGCTVVGEVKLGARSSVWFGAVLRGDIAGIELGAESNLQDGVVVHVDDGMPARIGRRVTVGHRAVIHGCRLEDECLIGMGAIVLSGAVVGRGSLVGAGSLVREGQVVPPGSLVLGAPARVLGPVADSHRAAIERGWRNYVSLSRTYLARGLAAPHPTASDSRGVAAAARELTGAAPALGPRRHGVAAAAARCAVVTVSDTRRGASDRGGDALAAALEAGGHAVVTRAWTRDERASIARAVRAALARRDVDAVILTGGTGAARRDVTPQATARLVEFELPGFGERFRALSERQVGSAAWLSRAGAGIAKGKAIVWLPGSPAAVQLAADELLVPALGHLVGLLRKTPSTTRK